MLGNLGSRFARPGVAASANLVAGALAVAILLAGWTAHSVAQSEEAAGTGAEVSIHIGDEDGGVAETVRVSVGNPVTVRITTDQEADIHVHGLEVTSRAVPGETTTMTVPTTAAGRFPVTVHAPGYGHGAVLYIEVYPD